jgi:hypothetical protein
MENPLQQASEGSMTMSDNNADYARKLADFLAATGFPPGTSQADIILRTSVAVIAIASQALTSQGVGGPIIGPHKIEELLKQL